MLGTGKSFRTSRDADAIRYAAETATIAGEGRIRAGSVNLACTIAKGHRSTRKTYTVNGRPVRYSSFLGELRVVTFVPADLQLAAGAPSRRRAFLNVALSQEDPGYYRELARYRIALQQKNALLRAEEPGDPELLAVYDRELIAAGTVSYWHAPRSSKASRTRRTPHTRASPTARNRSGWNTSRTCRSTRRPRKRSRHR